MHYILQRHRPDSHSNGGTIQNISGENDIREAIQVLGDMVGITVESGDIALAISGSWNPAGNRSYYGDTIIISHVERNRNRTWIECPHTVPSRDKGTRSEPLWGHETRLEPP